MKDTDQGKGDRDAVGAARTGWSRFLLPPVRDLIFLLAFWALLMGPLSNRPLADADIGWHIRTGEQILATHSIPRTDPFSSTMQGQPWFAWEWLYDAFLGVVHRSMGLNGVVFLAALIMATTFALLFSQLIKRGTGLPVAMVLWLLALGASSIHMFARPHIVSWLFTLLWFLALERWERGNETRWLRMFFPLSMLLWANLHGGWLLGMNLLGLYMVAAFVESLRESDPIARIRSAHRARAMWWTLVVSGAASVVNPYGLGLHTHIYHYLRDQYLMDRIAEFRSPDFHGLGQRCFVLILVLLLIAAGRSAGRIRLSQWLVVLMLTFAGLYAVRNLPMSAMLLVLIAGPSLWAVVTGLAEHGGVWGPLRRCAPWATNFAARTAAQDSQFRGHLWPALGVIAALMVCLHGGRVGSAQIINAQFDGKHFPSGAMDYLKREGTQEPIFGPDAWGGYFVYSLYPARKVVIDDRHDLYGSGRFREYLILYHGEPGWREILNKWQIRTLVLPPGSTPANLLAELPHEWRTVYADKSAAVIERIDQQPAPEQGKE